jgi:hypothetical protein
MAKRPTPQDGAELTDEEFWKRFETILAWQRAGEITSADAVAAIRRLTDEET